jgi:thiamine-phosphate pyrophosphorylase
MSATLRQALRLYLVADRGYGARRLPLMQVIEQAVAGGVTMVQLRDKGADAKAFLGEALAVRNLLKSRDIPLIVNDRVDLALASGAAGVHLGQSDLPPSLARKMLGPHAIIGLSIENARQLDEREREAADYLGVGPVFATATKPDAAPPIGLDGLKTIVAASGMPVGAIGGIDAGSAASVMAAGADGICVVSAILGAADPRAAAAALARAADA